MSLIGELNEINFLSCVSKSKVSVADKGDSWFNFMIVVILIGTMHRSTGINDNPKNTYD